MYEVAGKTIVLIGGAGFIGHHLALALVRAGANVHIIDSLQVNNWLTFSSAKAPVSEPALYLFMLNQRMDLLRSAGVPLHIQDARDYGLLTRQMNDINPDVIVHLAAVAHAGRSNKDPFSTFDHSFRTLENALDIARDRVSRFVFFSSSMVYGNFNRQAVTEEASCEPIGIYGALKFGGEKLVVAYNQVFNLPYTIIRPSALYGERCVSRRVGQIFVENARHREAVWIAGDGSEALDFTYIDDLVDGVVRAIESEAGVNQIFNITAGAGRTINELAAIVKQHFPAVAVRHGARDALAPERGALSIEKAKRLLQYAPQHSLERGLAKYIEWYSTLPVYGKKQAALA